MAKLKVNVDIVSRWAYSDGDSDLVLERGVHELDTDNLSSAEIRAIKDGIAANVGLSLVDEDDHIVELTTDNDGVHLVKGKEICVACLGNGPTGSEGDFDRLEGSVCPLCGFDNAPHLERMKEAPLVSLEREEEPIPTDAVPAPGREPGEPVEDES